LLSSVEVKHKESKVFRLKYVVEDLYIN